MISSTQLSSWRRPGPQVTGIIILFTVFFTSCNPSPPSGYIQTEGTKFIDTGGREMIFHGVNIVNKDPRRTYTEVIGEEEINSLAAAGFNVIRLGIIWSGVEPKPGLYDEKYLAQIDHLIDLINEAGMYVLLDMHQDLYGQKFSDGAPDWATLDQNLPHYSGAVWSDSYMISPAVQAAFDNFWDNVHAADGKGIQDHYIDMWEMLAERYLANHKIIGFDIMNEPFMGSSAQAVMPLMIQGYAHIMMDLESDWKKGILEKTIAELAERWGDEQGRLDLLRTLEDPELYKPVIESAATICQAFEIDKLNPFFQKVRDRIRSVNEHHILFLEHNYFANTGIRSAIEVPLDKNGSPDSNIAYAAHGYDLVTDTKEVGTPASGRIEFIFNRIKEKSESLNVPLFVGEWGAYGGNHPIYAETSAGVMSYFEKYSCSDTYWAYSGTGFTQKAYFPVLNRAYPVAISGKLLYYAYNASDESFIAEYNTTGLERYSTRIFFPDMEVFDEDNLQLIPKSKFSIEQPVIGSGFFIEIPPSGFAGNRKIIYFNPEIY